MSLARLVLTLASLLSSAVAIAPGAARGESFAGKKEMNGIKYEDFAGFEDKWKFVTVRYRTDNSEQRFVWGNPAAIQALEAGSSDFPDGAVFAKIGFMTEEDPAFKSSRVPSGTLRYQIMVRDRVKYGSTGGWGYALFDANKVTLERDPVAESQACYACHQLVPDRGQVFSVPLRFNPFAYSPAAKAPVAPTPAAPEVNAVKFATVPARDLPPAVRQALPRAAQVRSVQGDLRKYVFKGTIDEIRPSLIDEVKRTGLPAALISASGPHFAAVFPNKSGQKDCGGKRPLKSVYTTDVPTAGGKSAPLFVMAFQNLCT